MIGRLVIAEEDLELLIFFPHAGIIGVYAPIIGLGIASWVPFMLGKRSTKLNLHTHKPSIPLSQPPEYWDCRLCVTSVAKL